VPQMWPHVPQLLGSFVRSWQTPLQFVVPTGQTQTLPWQVSPGGHALPQLPQLAESDVTSTQAAPHNRVPDGHMQAPFWHVAPGGQILPQPPQLPASLKKSTQWLLQSRGAELGQQSGLFELPLPPFAASAPPPPKSPITPPAAPASSPFSTVRRELLAPRFRTRSSKRRSSINDHTLPLTVNRRPRPLCAH
jgi:hypothetical protein